MNPKCDFRLGTQLNASSEIFSNDQSHDYCWNGRRLYRNYPDFEPSFHRQARQATKVATVAPAVNKAESRRTLECLINQITLLPGSTRYKCGNFLSCMLARWIQETGNGLFNVGDAKRFCEKFQRIGWLLKGRSFSVITAYY